MRHGGQFIVVNENSLREFAQNAERIIPLCISFRSVEWRQECCSKILQAPTFEENLLAKRYVGQLGSSPSSGEFTRTKNSLWLCQNSYWKYPIYSWFTYSKWWSSIVMLVYQTVRGKVEVNPHWVVQYDAASFNQNWEVNILGAETRQPDMAWKLQWWSQMAIVRYGKSQVSIGQSSINGPCSCIFHCNKLPEEKQ